MQSQPIIGNTFSGMNVLRECATKTADGHILYECVCTECQNTFTMTLVRLKNKKTLCGHVDRFGNKVEFRESVWGSRKLRSIFKGMLDRCYNESNKDYKNYGSKGVRVYKPWLNNRASFAKWANENGYAEGLSIDRIDSSGDYCPKNCRWISVAENTRLAQTPKNALCVNGEVKSDRAWSEVLGEKCVFVGEMRKNVGDDETRKYIVEHTKKD